MNPSKPGQRRMNIAHLCAQISELAYEDQPVFDHLGFSLIEQFDRNGTQAILATDGHLTILAFRGTEEIGDFLADLRYVKTDFPGGGRVHRGFYHAFVQVRDEIAAGLENIAAPTIFTGHSLGAAMALMAAVMWSPQEVHVFGCPKTGNKDFVRRLTRPVNRYENWLDIVTYLPPPTSPIQAVHSLCHWRKPTLYAHAGRKVRLSGFGHPVRGYVKETRALR